MRRLLLLLFVLIAFRGISQQNRFVYFQAAANEPFYIRMDERTLSSNSFGSLVIAKLRDSTYKLYIGFPGNKSSEHLFQVPVSGSDRGFELKRNPDGSIRLFDWQKMIYIDPAVRPVKPSEPPTQARTDNYSRLMAAVVDDPAVATTAVPVPVQEAAPNVAEKVNTSTKPVNEPPALAVDSVQAIAKESEKPAETQKLDTIRPVKQDVVQDPTSSATIPAAVAVIAQPARDTVKSIKDSGKVSAVESDRALHADSVVIAPVPSKEERSSVLTLSDTVKDNNREMVFIDRNGTSTDTIDIVIPLDIENTKPVDTALYRVKESKPDTTTKNTAAVPLINSDCKRFASDGDVDKLRVSILNANSNDTKVLEAKKIFKSRCFSTKQIRALSELFSSDDGRYKLFDAAYPFVSDSSNFKTLIDLLEDSFYVNRFKTLARIQD